VQNIFKQNEKHKTTTASIYLLKKEQTKKQQKKTEQKHGQLEPIKLQYTLLRIDRN
jgi:hypothetical protein